MTYTAASHRGAVQSFNGAPQSCADPCQPFSFVHGLKSLPLTRLTSSFMFERRREGKC